MAKTTTHKAAHGAGTPKGQLGLPPVARDKKTGGDPPPPPPPLWTNFGKALEDLPALAERVQALNAQIKDKEEEKGPLIIAIKGLMEDVDKTRSWSTRDIDSDWVAIYIKPQPGKKLIPELLIQQGVKMSQIEKATKEVKKKPYVQVRARNEKFEKREDDDE